MVSREEVHKGSNPQEKSDVMNDLEELIGLFCDVREGRVLAAEETTWVWV